MNEKVIDSFSGRYRFLSNFYLCNIVYGYEMYPSVEHAYQAAKTNDLAARDKIRKANTCSLAKRLGRLVIIREDWESIKRNIMYSLLIKKFTHVDLRQLLLQTGDSILVEGNHWGDQYWGVCNGKGSNYLGKLLMRVRYVIRENKIEYERVDDNLVVLHIR